MNQIAEQVIQIGSLNGYFKSRYPLFLVGSDWLRRIPKEDRQAFSYVGRACANHGVNGGISRARNAVRDGNGRFLPNED